MAIAEKTETAQKQKETLRCQDPVSQISGVCKQQKLDIDKWDFIALVLTLLYKTPN